MQIPINKKRIHKRHFQLLELMVAAFILLICIAPTMRMFTSMYLSQNNITRENQRDHIAHMAHAKVTEMLYKCQIPIEKGMESKVIPIKDSDLEELLHKFSYSFEASLTILDSYTPRGQEKPTKHLGNIAIKMKDTAHKPKKDARGKKNDNQGSAETTYDYIVYIDSGYMKGKDTNKKDSDANNSSDQASNFDKLKDKNATKKLDPFSGAKGEGKNTAKDPFQ